MNEFAIGIQTMALIVLSKTFTNLPFTLYGYFSSLVKTFFSFAPIFITVTWLKNGKIESWASVALLALELSAIAVLIALVVKSVIARFEIRDEKK